MYGDLAATVSVILLHPEARSPVLDVGAATGSLRQPLLKVVAMMRNFGIIPKHNKSILGVDRRIHKDIGQGPHDFDTVFSHFYSKFMIRDRGAEAGILAPEDV
eukprot:2738752-Ditylum_brightwellii.AAC.1